MKNRMSAMIAAILATTFVFASCGETSPEAGSPSDGSASDLAAVPSVESPIDEPEETELMDSVPETDLQGYEFRVLSCMHHQDTYSFIASDEINGTPLNDALYQSKAYIEDRFNVKISSIDSGDTDGNATTVKTAVKGGDNAFDITIGHDKKTVSLGTQGYLFNVYDVDQFDFSMPWWPELATESWTINGKMYAVSNYLSYCGLHWTRMMLVNKDLAADLGIEVPYDTVREGKWTLDVLKSLADQATNDLDGNGKMTEQDRFGFCCFRGVWYAMQEALDLPLYRRDNEGKFYLDFDVDRADAIVSRLRAMTTADRFYSAGEFKPAMLDGGNFLFAYMQLKDVYAYVNDCEAHAGFLSTPKLDETQAEYINCCTDAPWGIPANAGPEQINAVGAVVEAMSCYNYKNILPAYYEVTMKARIADEPDDAEMLQLLADTRTIGFAYAYELPANNMIEDMLNNSTLAVASYLQKVEKNANKQLEKLLANFSD